jgi:hypothetical protein
MHKVNNDEVVLFPFSNPMVMSITTNGFSRLHPMVAT